MMMYTSMNYYMTKKNLHMNQPERCNYKKIRKNRQMITSVPIDDVYLNCNKGDC
jgi:hypothetical protein